MYSFSYFFNNLRMNPDQFHILLTLTFCMNCFLLLSIGNSLLIICINHTKVKRKHCFFANYFFYKKIFKKG